MDFLGSGESVTLSFDVTVSDGEGGTDTETVSLTINGTNDAPVLTLTDSTGSVTEDTSVVGGNVSDSGSLSFTDVDVNDNPTVSTDTAKIAQQRRSLTQ